MHEVAEPIEEVKNVIKETKDLTIDDTASTTDASENKQ